jgi:putative phosphonate metabolism protein
MSARYAIYFAPAHGSPWWRFGARWLGRDEFEDVPLASSVSAQIEPAVLHAITAAPRRYGFHATLKAPFRLSGEHTVDDLLARLEWLAGTLKPVALGPLHAVMLADFVALVPVTPPDGLAALAAACVTDLDDLRAPLAAQELARRGTELLDARGMELLQLYGYAHVLERFRFHFTLSNSVAPSTAQLVIQAVAGPVAQLNATTPLILERLCLFMESAPGQPFRRIADAELRP